MSRSFGKISTMWWLCFSSPSHCLMSATSFRFESLEPEMNSQASRVAVVNQVSRQLIHSGHPSEKEIKARQDKLNTRWEQLVSVFPVVLWFSGSSRSSDSFYS